MLSESISYCSGFYRLTLRQRISGLSSQCQGALAGIVADADANACLKPSDLIPLATASGNTSVVPIVDKWATDVCSSAPCSNQTLAKVVNLITTGCQAEISGGAQGVDPTTLATTITPLVQQYYPTVRKVVCLKKCVNLLLVIRGRKFPNWRNFSGNTLCLTETLRNIEGTTGPLTLNSIMGMIMGGRIPDIPKNVTCTDCIKAAYNVINTDVPSVTSDAAPELQSQCGASFTGAPC